MSVFVGSIKDNKIYEARDYQKSSYLTFMSNKNLVSGKFEYPGGVKFEMFKIDNRPSLCRLKNEYGIEYILGDDEKILHGYIVTIRKMHESYDGGRRLTVRKSRSNKRKSIKSKRRAH